MSDSFTLTNDHFSDISRVGKSKGGDVYKLLTKGGHAMVAVKTAGGDWQILSKASHFGIAQYTAEKIDKSIHWEEGLMKSEDRSALLEELKKAKIRVHKLPGGKESHITVMEPESWYHPSQHLSMGDHLAKLTGRHKMLEQQRKADQEEFNMKVLHPHYAKQPEGVPFMNMPQEYRDERKALHDKKGQLEHGDSGHFTHHMHAMINGKEAVRQYMMGGLSYQDANNRLAAVAQKHPDLPEDWKQHHAVAPLRPDTGQPLDAGSLEQMFNRANEEEAIRKIPKSFNPG